MEYIPNTDTNDQLNRTFEAVIDQIAPHDYLQQELDALSYTVATPSRTSATQSTLVIYKLPPKEEGVSSEATRGDISKGTLTLPPKNTDWNKESTFQTELFLRKLRVNRELKNYLYFLDGWDGPDSKPPPESAVSDAVQMLWALPSNILAPIPMVAGDGEVGLYWKWENAYAELNFFGDGCFTYFAKDLDGNKYYADDVSLSNPIPQEIISILQILPSNDG